VLAPDYPGDVWTGAYASTVGLTVETDDDNDGVFETLWSRRLAGEPLVPQAGYPFNRVVASGRSSFPVLVAPVPELSVQRYDAATRTAISLSRRCYGQTFVRRMPVLGPHHRELGWPSVPAQVTQACQIIAIDNYKSKTHQRQPPTTGLATGAYGSWRQAPWGAFTLADGVCAAARPALTWLWLMREVGDPPSVGGSPRQYRRPEIYPKIPDSANGRVPMDRAGQGKTTPTTAVVPAWFHAIQLPGRDHHQPPGHRSRPEDILDDYVRPDGPFFQRLQAMDVGARCRI